jgi:preprotein translocase subunit SecG
MNLLLTLVLVAQLLSALGLIVLVLLQHGKGADMGAAFGSGASGSLFGATGSANFLSRTTAGLATVFFICTLALAMLSRKAPEAPKSVMEQPAAATQPASPAAAIPGPATGAPAAGAPSAATPGTAPAPAPTTAAPAAATPAPAPTTAAPAQSAPAPAAGGASAAKSGKASEIPK